MCKPTQKSKEESFVTHCFSHDDTPITGSAMNKLPQEHQQLLTM
jgi:hemerythrin-like domain-containing protein